MLVRGIGEVRVWLVSCKVWRKSDMTREKLYREDKNMFETLKFKAHEVCEGGVMATRQFDNDYEVSVVGGAKGLYGNGSTSFEVAIFRPDGEFYREVQGWLSKDEVSAVMEEVKAFKG